MKIIALKKTTLALVVLAVLTALPLAAADKVRTVVIGTSGTFKPYTYLDDNGKLTGYEIEVLNAVNKLLPQYKFEYTQLEFKNILLSLGAKKVDIGANQFEKNPDREAKYLFSGESYTTFILRLVVAKTRNDIKSLKDLEGKTIQVGAGANDSYVVGAYNKEHNNAIKIVYDNGIDSATSIKKLEDGSIDAFVSITRVVQDLIKTFGDRIKTVGDPIASSNTYFIYRKDDTQLKADIDKALAQLRKDGTLSKISIRVLGGDYTSND